LTAKGSTSFAWPRRTPFLAARGGGKRQSIPLCGGEFSVTAPAPTPSAIGIFS
jgi:hypothetical protein